LQQIPADSELKATVYHTIRTILQTVSVAEFTKLLQQFLTWATVITELASFSEYFVRFYASRV